MREELAEKVREELAAEKSHFGKTTEGDWEEREEILKASSESGVLQERTNLLGVVADYFGSSLRGLYSAGASPDSMERRRLLLSMEAIEKLRLSLERGVQEGLALEAGFLELMISFRS